LLIFILRLPTPHHESSWESIQNPDPSSSRAFLRFYFPFPISAVEFLVHETRQGFGVLLGDLLGRLMEESMSVEGGNVSHSHHHHSSFVSVGCFGKKNNLVRVK
jgi:hypothetical protein